MIRYLPPVLVLLVGCSDPASIVVDDVPVLAVSPSEVSLPVGTSVHIAASVSFAADPELSFVSSDTSVVAVTQTGPLSADVHGRSPGTAQIDVALRSDPTIRTEVPVQVIVQD